MKAHKFPKYSVAGYIELEKESGTKHEYHDGKIFALAGGTLNHGLLCGNIYAELRNALKEKESPCKPLTSEVKLHIESHNSYVYPDCMVICEEISKADEDANAVTNPILIVEVLSKSTADYDRGDKFYLYRQISSLKEYVLIEQHKPVIEVFYKRDNSDLWSITRYEGLDKTIAFQSIDVQIQMSDLYFDVEGLELMES